LHPPAPPAFAFRLLERSLKLLQQGVWIFFFPEGTRKVTLSAGEPLGPFKAGAFKLAIDAGVPIVPVTISGEETVQW
jgi:1-acyl-sn-glycerol-3-phosphate acyltransferase